MKLIPGQTKIGTTVRKDNNDVIEFTVYYGNVLQPLIDGKVMHLTVDEYLKTLFEFLQSEEGKAYDKPTADEAQRACDEMVDKEHKVLGTSSHLRVEEQKPKVQPQPQQSNPVNNARPSANNNPNVNNTQRANPTAGSEIRSTAQSTPRVQDSRNDSPNSDGTPDRRNLTAYEPKDIKPVDVDEYERQINARNEAEYQRRLAEQRAAQSDEEQEDAIQAQLDALHPKKEKKKLFGNKPTTEEVEQEETKPINVAYDRLYKQLSNKTAKVKGLRVALIFVSTLLVVVSVLGGYLGLNLYKLFGKDEAIVQINGQPYAIPLEITTELEDGESRMYTYGVAVRNEGGTITKSVIPFGEIGFDITSAINSDDVTFTPADKAKKEAANLQEEIKEAADQATREENDTENVESTTEQSQPSENSEGE